MSVFDEDINGLVTANLPVRLRQTVMTAWLKCLVAPCVYLKGLFDANRSGNLYYLGHSGQVCYIEAVLNDVFDPVARDISISDPPYLDVLPLYLVSEIPPQSAQPVYKKAETVPGGPQPLLPLYLNSEAGVDDNCFVVRVPSTLGLTGDQLTHLRGLADKYRLPGKNNYSVLIF